VTFGKATGFVWSINKDILSEELLANVCEELQEILKLKAYKYSTKQRPLLVDLHGGPHGSKTGSLSLSNIYFLLNGWVVLAPNFSGSAGFGQTFMNDLLGNIGDLDAQEVLGMIAQLTEKEICD